jgi:amino acid adenylation domain-containing protein
MAAPDFPKEEIEGSIPERFRKTASLHRDRTALRCAGTSLTYGDLGKRVGSLARAIIDRCGDGNDPVAIFLDHESSAVVAILAALQAGKIYVPLDPLYPGERTRFILDDAGVRVIVSGGECLEEAKDLAGERCALLDVGSLGDAPLGKEDTPAFSPDRVASILYSSGSTGRPKGILQSHRSILHHVWDHTTLYRFAPRDRFALLVSFSFAASVSEIFGALLNGASLTLFPLRREGHGGLAGWIETEEVSVLKLPAPVFREVLETLGRGARISGPRLVLLGGDTLYRRDIDRFRQHFPPDCLLVNRLTSTETNTIAQMIIGPETEIAEGVVPAGRPARDKEIVILDDEGKPAVAGQEGEISVRSRYLSPGYWRRPELTLRMFREESGGEGERTFFTGDRGVIGSDGILHYRGRRDERVKVRGFRVETGEVEAALLDLDAVREAVVAADEEPVTGERRLCAYLVPTGPAPPTIGELRRALSERLPREMIPTAFVLLEQFPVTATGKIDRRALPEPRRQRLPEGRSHVAPRTAIEGSLTEIWEELLGVEGLGIRDDFFDLGGHSLLAVRLCVEVERQLGGTLSLAELMQSPTIEGVAAVLAREEASHPRRSLVPVTTAGEGLPFFCVSGMGGHGMIFRDLARRLGGDRPFYALEPAGFDVEASFRPTVEGIASGYLDEVRHMQPEGPYLLGGYSFGGVIAFEMAQQLLRRGEGTAILALIDTSASFLGWTGQVGPARRFRLHLRNLATLTGRERLTYFRAWAKRKVRSGKDAVMRRLPGSRKVILEKRWQLYPALHHAFLARMAIRDAGRKPEGQAGDIMIMRKLHQLAVRFYRPVPYPGQITLFACAEESRKLCRDPRLGWERLTEGGVTVHGIPGNHYTLLNEPHVKGLAEALGRCLGEVLPAQGKTESAIRVVRGERDR